MSPNPMLGMIGGKPQGHCKLAERAKTVISERLEKLFPDDASCSEIFESDSLQNVPRFQNEEVHTGLHLGRGGFSDVFEIKSIDTSIGKKNEEDPVDSSRNRVASFCLTSYGKARCALKTTRKDFTKDSYQAWESFGDLVVETRLLSRLDHPHIITLRGVSDSSLQGPNYFIVLDRLYDTLRNRMKTWERRLKKAKNKPTFRLPFRQNQDPRSDFLWEERLSKALNLTSALEYMHEQHVIHRDIKPENIGFSVDDDVKIFDLGLSRPIPSTSEVYRLSIAGSPRYMAPELYKRQEYNQKCDVYSITLLIWEMLALERPFYKAKDLADFYRTVVREASRPKIPKKWSRSLKELLKTGWEQDQFKRISMKTLRSLLEAELAYHSKKREEKENAYQRTTQVEEANGRKHLLVKMKSYLSSTSICSEDDDGVLVGRDVF